MIQHHAGWSGHRSAVEASFRSAARRYATGVTVVTTVHDGLVDGVTVSAFSTLSMRPLLVLVAVGGEGVFLRRVTASGVFAVNILSRHQENIARYFADGSRPRTQASFPGIGARPAATGAPVFDGCLGYFDCYVADARRYGDHRLVVGEVRQVSHSNGAPLLYFEGEYRSLAGHATSPSACA